MPRETRSDHYRGRAGSTTDREERPPSSLVKPGELIDQSNLVLALDARMGLTLDGSNVSAWADQSDQDNHLSQGTASKQPTKVIDSGYVGVEFDGTDDRLENRAFSGVTAGEELTFFFVGRLKTAGAFTDWVFSVSDVLDTNNQGMQFLQNSLSGGRFEFQHNGQAGVKINSDATKHVFTFTGQTTLTEMFIDGVSVATDTTPTITLRDIVHAVLGARPDDTNPGDCVVNSWLIYNTLLSAGDRDTVEASLGGVWGITI